MIVTCKKHIPTHWLLVTIIPWAAWVFTYMVMAVAFIFSLKKFVENPAGLTFVMSLPGIISMVLGPVVSFMSDRIWTRIGRRKPFVITAWVTSGLCVVLMPLMPNFWLLLGVYLLYNMAADFQSPQEALKQEIIPPSQRGRAVAGVYWMTQLGMLMFFSIGIGRFDDRQFYMGVPLTGETSIYWAGAAGMIVMTLLICLGIKEVDPKSKVRGERFNLRNFFRGVLNRNLWPVYLLVFGSAMLNAGLGVIGNLLYTDQWHFTKQEMGNNMAIGGVLNLFLIVILGVFADKWNRIRAYQTLIVASLLVNIGFYLYVNFVLYDQRPGLIEVVVFGEVLSIIGFLTAMFYTPLVYDYVPRNEMGTYMAGSNLLGRITGLITLNGVGLFVWLYATLFLPPGGDMARVVFRENQTQQQVNAILAKAVWTDTVTGVSRPAKDISATSWYANGAVLKFGHCYEVRLNNPDSVALKKERDKLNEQRGKLQGEEATLRDRARLLQSKNVDSASAAELLARADKLKAESAPLVQNVEKMDAELLARGEALAGEIRTNLASLLLSEGEQIQEAKIQTATLLEFATPDRIPTKKVERLLEALRRENPEVIDLRAVKTTNGYGVAVSLAVAPENSEGIAKLTRNLADVSAKRLPGFFSADTKPVAVIAATMLAMDLVTVEEPLVIHVSPINRVVNAVTALFFEPAGPEQRLSAIGRSLREPGQSEHVAVRNLGAGNADDHAIRVFAILGKSSSPTNAVPPSDEITQRFAKLLGATDGLQLSQVRNFYDRVILAGAEQRITVATPILTSGFAPMKYDYMSGYIWMLMLGLIGFGMTLFFIRRERRGLIRKRGVEEAEAA